MLTNEIVAGKKNPRFVNLYCVDMCRFRVNLNPSFSIVLILTVGVILMGFGYQLNWFYI